MINEEKINKNYLLWITKLEDNNCFSEKLVDLYGGLIKISSYGMSLDTGAAYDGALITTILWKICKYAININNMLPDNLQVDKKSLLKVCLLQHIGKAVMYKKQDNAYNISKGYLFKFNDNLDTSLKCGERSIFMCMESGIPLTEEEYEAMKIIDKDDDSKQTYYSSLLTTIVKNANSLANAELKTEYNNIKKCNLNENTN